MNDDIIKALEAPLKKSLAASQQTADAMKEQVPLMKRLVKDVNQLQKRLTKLERQSAKKTK